MTTPVLPTPRKVLTRRQRVAMHDRHGGICVVCGLPIAAGEPFIDEHVTPLQMGGGNEDGNRGPAHIQCAKIKTRRDVKVIAKTLRQRARHLGIRKSSRPMSGWKDFAGRPVRNPRLRAIQAQREGDA